MIIQKNTEAWGKPINKKPHQPQSRGKHKEKTMSKYREKFSEDKNSWFTAVYTSVEFAEYTLTSRIR